jgi:hypothetical protein
VISLQLSDAHLPFTPQSKTNLLYLLANSRRSSHYLSMTKNPVADHRPPQATSVHRLRMRTLSKVFPWRRVGVTPDMAWPLHLALPRVNAGTEFRTTQVHNTQLYYCQLPDCGHVLQLPWVSVSSCVKQI